MHAYDFIILKQSINEGSLIKTRLNCTLEIHVCFIAKALKISFPASC